jgi:hypothetical protein
VRATVWRFQGVACGVLSQEDVGRISEVLVDECGWGSVACCRGWSQLVHFAAELLDETGCLDLRGSLYKELARDTQGLAIDELCC